MDQESFTRRGKANPAKIAIRELDFAPNAWELVTIRKRARPVNANTIETTL
jgi:hypothetical protein